MTRCQVFVREELFPATWAEPWPPDWWNVERHGEQVDLLAESNAVDLPDDLAERALAAWQEFEAVGELIEDYLEVERPRAEG